MSINKEFEEYKIKREIERSGKMYSFYRKGLNMFGEEEENAETTIGALSGIFHYNSSSPITININAAETKVQSKNQPSILCLFYDIAELNLKIKDYVIINNKIFSITGFRNIQEWNIVIEIDLEYVGDKVEDDE